ncbi:MAG: ATP-binding protein [Beijerinckiaceae bacterium]
MRRRLLLLVIAALLPLVVVIGALSFVSVSHEREHMREAAVGYSKDMLLAVNRELQAHGQLLEVLARSPSLESGQLDRFHGVAKLFLNQVQDWESVVVANAQGQVVNTNVPFGSKLPALVDPSGFARAVAAGRTIVTDLTGPGPLATGRPPSVVLRTPLRIEGVDYVLTALVRPEVFTRAILQARTGPSWRPFLVDGSDRVIAAPRAPGSVGQRAGAAAIEARATGASGVYAGRAWNGEPVITAFIKSPESGWSAHLSIPAVEYNAPLRQAIGKVIAFGVLALLLFALFVYIARRELLAMRTESEMLSRATRMEAIGRMTGGIAHDFNNLLMVVSTAAEMLRKRNTDKAAQRFLTAIQSATDRGSRLTRDLMSFARGQGGEVATMDVGLRLASIKSLLIQSVTESTRITFDLPDGDHFIKVDPVQFDLAVINIVANARDAMPDGGSIRIALRRVDFPDKSGRRGLRLSITDTGAGIPEKDLPFVFEPFFTTKEVGKGSGLGLSHVYGFAKAHGGLAEIASEPGKGATVSIYLPEAEAPAEAMAQAREPVDLTWRGDGLEAIVVDDNDDVRVLTGEVLADIGFRVRYASNAGEALALCEAGADLVLSDIVMPGAMNGVELARIIRQRWPDMQTILMTGYSDASSEAAAAGMRVIRKPFTRAMLLAAISTSRLEVSRRWRGAEA